MITNPSFELSDEPTIPGLATDWVESTVGTGEETAQFEGDAALAFAGVESFESGWTSADPQVLVATLGTALDVVASLPVETMDAWTVNDSFFYIPSAEAAAFIPDAFEGFETAWGAGAIGFVLDAEEIESNTTEQFAWSSPTLILADTEVCRWGALAVIRETFDYVEDGDPGIDWILLLE